MIYQPNRFRGGETMAIEYKDEKIIEKALGILEREMSLVEYTRFLQLIGPTEGDATRELLGKRKKYGVDEAYEIFKDRVKKKKDKELLMKRRSQMDLGHANKIKDDFNIP